MKQINTLVCAAIALTSLAAHAGPGFTDATVNPASYSFIGYSSDPTVTISPTAIAVGGNPGAALAIDFTNKIGAVNLLSTQGFIYSAFSYDPSVSGALTSLDYSNDRYALFANDPAGNTGLSTVTRALIYQNGLYYFAPVADAVQTRGVWFTTTAPGLTSANFVEYDFATNTENDALHPNFSSSGSALEFGFANRLTLGRPDVNYQLNAEFRFDNISYSLNVAAVPEPETWALLAAGLAAIGIATRRRSGRAAGG
jgi:hypothetical protein